MRSGPVSSVQEGAPPMEPRLRGIMLHDRPMPMPAKTLVAALALALVVSVLVGCAAFGIPESDDPVKKLAYAYELFGPQQRPLPAERLIREAADILRARSDDSGLAEAYRAYGFFFRSKAVEKYRKHYETQGFLEHGATYDSRFEKSIEYFRKSATIQERLGRDDMLANLRLNMGFTYEFAGKTSEACAEYDESLRNYQSLVKKDPAATPELPKGYTSFGNYIADLKKRLRCP